MEPLSEVLAKLPTAQPGGPSQLPLGRQSNTTATTQKQTKRPRTFSKRKSLGTSTKPARSRKDIPDDAEEETAAKSRKPDINNVLVQQRSRPQLNQVDQRHVNRIAILGRFLNLYLPGARDASIDQLSYTHFLPDLVGISPLLQMSVDAVCYAFLGTLFDDQRLRMMAVRRYVSALSVLRFIVPQPTSKCLRKDTVLASLIILAHCEIHDCISIPGDDQGFLSHLRGAQAFFDANSLELLETGLGRALCFTLRCNASLLGRSTRRAITDRVAPTALISTEAKDLPTLSTNDIALRIPALLEATDNFVENPENRDLGASLVRRLWSIRTEWKECFARFYGDGHGLRQADITEAKVFSTFCKDRTFQTIFVFDSYQTWTHYTAYWAILWDIDVALLDLLETDCVPSENLPFGSAMTHGFVQREAHDAASSVCRAFPISNEPDQVVFSPLRSTSASRMKTFLKKYGYDEEVGWIDAVSAMITQAGPSWDAVCKFADSEKKPKGIAGSLGAWVV